MTINLEPRIRAHGITSEELAACEVAATMMVRAHVPADETLQDRLPGLHWRREVTLLALVLDIAKADGWEVERGAPQGTRLGRLRTGAQLTPDDVRRIRQLRGVRTQQQIADEFGVHVQTVCKIQLRKQWRDVA